LIEQLDHDKSPAVLHYASAMLDEWRPLVAAVDMKRARRATNTIDDLVEAIEDHRKGNKWPLRDLIDVLLERPVAKIPQ
jgi:hypothetical protein